MKKPRNFRRITPKCCLGCKFRVKIKKPNPYHDRTYTVCERDIELILDDEPELWVCDFFIKRAS
jgi:hypothetical protein